MTADVLDEVRVIVCGSRMGYPPASIVKTLQTLQDTYGASLVIVHGAAKGVDVTAGALAHRLGIRVKAIPASWEEHHEEWCPGPWCRSARRRSCLGAGPRRNHQMLGEHPELVVAFKRGFDKSLRRGGTEGMVRIAREAGIATLVVDEDAL